MKKIVALLTLLCIVSGFGFSVNAEETALFDLNLEKESAGDYTKNRMGVSSSASITVIEDSENNDKYIRVSDNDDSVATGFNREAIPVSGKITITVDFKLHKGMVNFYVAANGNPISLVLRSPILYYSTASGASVSTEAAIKPGDDWANITCIVDTAACTFDVYKNGIKIAEKAPFREGASIKDKVAVRLFSSDNKTPTEYDFKNLKIYQGEVIPEVTERIPPKAERNLVDFADAPTRLDAALSEAVAMSIGNSMARVNNDYVQIDPDNEYVAPFVTEDGYTLIPTRFTTETIGCTTEVLSSDSFRFTKGETVMEINMGDKNAIINGTPVEMPTAPVIKHDRLFIPLRFAAETFGKKVFWDDRGLIVISDDEVVSEGEEDIIKPLLSQIRQYTTLYGNKKYSDVSYTSRYFRTDGHMNGTDTPQWGTLDASKRFMATVNRWSYVISGEQLKSELDQGLIVQGTLNANFTDNSKPVASYFLDGTPYTRADGVWGSMWACISDPDYYTHLWKRAKAGLDAGLRIWQFDDWQLNDNYRNGGCFCDNCMREFSLYLSTETSPEELAAAEISNPEGFNYKSYLTSVGVVKPEQYATVEGKPIGKLWKSFNQYRVQNFHKRLIKDMEEYTGEEIYYSFNASYNLSSAGGSYVYSLVDGVMGETEAAHTTASSIYGTMLFTRAIGTENVISPLPKNDMAKELMYSAIPMTYATGQYLLVPWDDWLYGSTRYYATLEELGHSYELPREYPYLFDNYEIPELIGYVYDLDKLTNALEVGEEFLENGMPVRVVAHSDKTHVSLDADDFKGLQAVVAGGDLSGLSAEEQEAIANSGITLISTDDTQTIDYLKNTYWMTKNNKDEVYTVLRQNQLYDNAPTVVHAVSYNTVESENVEIEINNLYLPAGDKLTVNIYKPGESYETITVDKGTGSTKIVLDFLDRWAVLEISGAETVRRGASFLLGDGYNGMGLGTRISNDKLYGQEDNFTIVTYGEGINSTTYNDKTGSQDEVAFVYKRFGKGTFRKALVSAGFGKADGAYGVMVREGVYSNARFGALMYDSENGLRIAVRNIANEGVEYVEISKDRPSYMKLERDGGVYRAYTSPDGVNYTEVGVIELVLDEAVGGVFASSPDGSRAECKVKHFIADKGSYPTGGFKEFKISYADGSISCITQGEKLDIKLSASGVENLTTDDVNITFESSDESVAKILPDGTIVPGNIGIATITATAAMGFRKVTSSMKLKVTEIEPVMFEETFDEGELPDYISNISAGKVEVKDGALVITTKKTGDDSDASFGFKQLSMPAVFEFDFRANFGKETGGTGARVAYIHGMAMSLTADKNGFNWFYGGTQTKVMSIEENKWYKISIEADYEKQTASVYIDGELVVDNAECRSRIEPDGAIRIGGWRLGTDTSYEWDNFKFMIKQ